MKEFNLNHITPKLTENLRLNVLTDQQFLGSSIYEFMFGQYDNELYYLLFDGHSENLYERLGQRPSIIIGRRGSGKSTYLNHLAQKENVIALGLKIWELIDLVESQVGLILDNQESIDAEKVSDIWHLIFMALACVEVTKRGYQNNTVEQFLNELGMPLVQIGQNSLIQITSLLIDKLKSSYTSKKDNFNIEICLKAMSISSTTLDSLENALSNILIRENKTAIFLLDNPERFTREKNQELSLKSRDGSREKTIAGLLSLAGRMNKGNIGIQLRLCIPSEQYFYLKNVSSSKKKDFNATQLLHWNSGDILSMAAHRYLIFLSVYPELRNDSAFNQLTKLPIYTREGAIQFWNTILTGSIVNGRKVEEKPLTYLLRHTQLVPRQLLDFLNKAISITIAKGNDNLINIDAEDLKKAIEETEYEISTEIIDAYSYSYPEANDIFNTVVSKLPILTTAKKIKDIIYKSTDAKAILHSNSSHPQVVVSKDRFLRLLVETGIYGKVAHEPKENSSGYIEAEFEYTISGSLRIEDDDQLAMHPIFCGALSPKLYSMLDKAIMGVYPVGTDCEI